MPKKYSSMDNKAISGLAAVISKYMQNRTVVLLYKTAEGDSVGTGTIVERNSRLYILTCEHVYADAAADPKSIVRAADWPSARAFSPLPLVYKNEELDFALVEFPFSSRYSLPWEKFTAVPKGPKDLGMFLTGFPAEQVSQVGNLRFSAKRWSYWTSRSKKRGLRPKRHQFLLEYDRYLNNTDTNAGSYLPDVPGMSGSLIVIPKNWKRKKIWSPADLDIVGIETAWDQSAVMFATRGDRLKKAWNCD